MGNKVATFSEEQLEDYQDCTYFTRKEILRLYKRFREMADPGMVPRSMTPHEASSLRLPLDYLARIPELKVCVCVIENDENLGICFEDFLEMMSVFSEHAPRDLKVYYAFRIYDFDEDGLVGLSDLERTCRQLVRGALADDEVMTVCQKVLEESDIDGDGALSYLELLLKKNSVFVKLPLPDLRIHKKRYNRGFRTDYLPSGIREVPNSSVCSRSFPKEVSERVNILNERSNIAKTVHDTRRLHFIRPIDDKTLLVKIYGSDEDEKIASETDDRVCAVYTYVVSSRAVRRNLFYSSKANWSFDQFRPRPPPSCVPAIYCTADYTAVTQPREELETFCPLAVYILYEFGARERIASYVLFLSLGEALAEELTSYRADHLNKPMRRGLTERCTPCGRDLWLSTTERLSRTAWNFVYCSIRAPEHTGGSYGSCTRPNAHTRLCKHTHIQRARKCAPCARGRAIWETAHPRMMIPYSTLLLYYMRE
ncbi:unnamed protein product, partial [Trichogramma brassicae]